MLWTTATLRREASWSTAITVPLALRTPPAARPAVLALIKAIHTAIFAAVAAQIVVVVWDGIRQRPRPRTAAALLIALGESAVYASNNQVCPLTPLAEELGARDGSVTDIFLPERISRRIPLVGGSALALGLGMNLLALVRKAQVTPRSRTR
ncbi:MAG TPA: hypothetical protein VFJ00_00935 [Candidatus Limnocylindria bacterium]|nr:hypothetical protein [Candidatus Limnocylindria bacterium]